MCQAMVQQGHAVTLLARRPSKDTLLRGIDVRGWDEKEQQDSATISATSVEGMSVSGLGPRFWELYGVSQPFTITFLPERWAIPGPRALLPHMYGLRAALKARAAKSDVVFTRHVFSALWALVLDMPVILEVHALVQSLATRAYFTIMRAWPGKRRLVVISRALKRDFVKQYPQVFDPADIIVAHDGVALERYENLPTTAQARRKLQLPEDRFIAGYTGHFYPGKGIGVVLDLARRCPDVGFLIVGGASRDAARVAQTIEQDMLDNVWLRGFVPHQDVPVHLAACDVLLLPVRARAAILGRQDIARWTSPLKLFEYMASGRPIVASSLPVLREVLNEANSFICDVADIEQWVDTLRHLRQHPRSGLERAQRAALDVTQYSWAARVEKCLAGFPITE
jgi:glycosyltransferase involved in cell wall biosynthesis